MHAFIHSSSSSPIVLWSSGHANCVMPGHFGISTNVVTASAALAPMMPDEGEMQTGGIGHKE
jgi:hypothetical protein